MSRPKLTKEMIQTVAAKFCADNGWDDEQADDLARVCRSAHMDGYELAKDLDSLCGWTPNAQDVETLDSFGCHLREALREACIAWARENNIQPPLPVGSEITHGTITCVYEHEPATYLVKERGCTQSGRQILVRFEDAKAVEAAA